MELRISQVFWAIHSTSSVSVPSLCFVAPTHPLQAFVTRKSEYSLRVSP